MSEAEKGKERERAIAIDGNETRLTSPKISKKTKTSSSPSTSSSSSSSSLLASLEALRAQPELLAIVAVYFVQGLLGLSRLALSYFLKDELRLSAPDVAALTALGFAPWVVKPLYGFLSDAVPLAGYRRRSYLALCGVSGAAAWAAMATPALVSTKGGVLAATLVAAASTACADVVVDSLVVERSRGGGGSAGREGGGAEKGGGGGGASSPSSSSSSSSTEAAGNLQSLCWGAAATGGIASAAASGSLVASAGPRAVFAATACFPLLLVAAAALIDEERIVEEDEEYEEKRGKRGEKATAKKKKKRPTFVSRLTDQARALWGAAASSAVLAPALFTFVWQATPTPDSALFFYYTDELGLGPEFLGKVRLAGALASLAGVGCYNVFLKKMRLRTVFAGAAVAGAVLSSTQLLLVTGASRAVGVPDAAFVLADAAVLSALGQAAFMPVLVLAAKLCPPGVEASLFAALMSVLNGGSAAGSALGGALTSALGVGAGVESGAEGVAAAAAADWSNLPLLVGLCSLLSLAPLPLLALVPENMGASEEEEEEQKDDSGSGSGGGGGQGARKETTTATKATATKARGARRSSKNAAAAAASLSSPRRRSSSRTRSAAKF